ncbi:MAG TPA: nuclear transport factor 2 family protein [Sphingomicrobium sp.]|jgi:ketosteroid isomerase-like protein|nr:nuclear transport factor 2 family protein [Sphingomicrobium sp.]
MKKLTLSVVLAIFLVAAAPRTDDRADLLAVERAWDTAVVERDVAALNRILADDFVLVWINGQVSGKREMLQAVADRKAEIDPFETEEVMVRIYGDTAVVNGRFTQTARLGERSETNQFRYTDVYHRTRKGWQAVSAHASLIKR